MRIWFVVTSILLALVFVAGGLGCAKPAPATSPTSAPAAAPAKPIELKYASWSPGKGWWTKNLLEPYLAELQQKSGGRLKINLFADASLLSQVDTYDGVAEGVADIGYLLPGSQPERFPITSVTQLPFAFTNGPAGTRIIKDFYDAYLNKDFPDIKPIVQYAAGGGRFLYTTKKPVKTLEDFKGLRLRFTMGTEKTVIQLLGATPIFIATPELYTSLERGLVDGLFFSGVMAEAWKVQEVCKYIIDAPISGSSYQSFGMNLKTWNSLPPDLQKIVTDVGDDWSLKMAAKYDEQDKLFYYDKWPKEFGTQVVTVPPAELARWKNAVSKGIYDEAQAALIAKGLPGKEIMAKFAEISAKYADK